MIDIHTLMLALGLGNVAMSILMAVYTTRATRHAALRVWMWARMVIGASQLIGWLNVSLGVRWLEDLEPVGWVVGLALETAAYCLLFQRHHWRRVLFPSTGLAMLLAVATHGAGASRDAMTALIAVIVSLYAAVTGALLLRPRQPCASRLRKLLGINVLVFAFAMAAWAWTGISQGAGAMLQSSPAQVAAYLSGYLVMIVNGFGFLLMCKQEDDAQMERLATTDYLTGLVNRRAFFERAEGARMLAARLQQPIALMMLDIDHFKQLNDRFGHATGDHALMVFADTARKVLREHDILGRLGGEEFALVLPGTDLDGAIQAAERLRVAVTEAPAITSGNQYTMTVSIGVVMLEPVEELTAALARADHALYAAKTLGRNRVEAGAPVFRRA